MPGQYLLRIPRHACTPRDTARAGDLWRLVQDAAVQDATDRGWPPERFREAGTGFVVRELRAVHQREAGFGEELDVRTQIADARREILVRRETQIVGVMRATADWVHIGPTGGPQRAPATLVAAFPPDAHAPPTPTFVEIEDSAISRPIPDFCFSPWWTEMDPLAHTNHPRYIDWADEALARALHRKGVDPVGVVPLADRVRFRLGARAIDAVTVSGRALGITAVDGRSGLACLFRAHRQAPDGPELVAEMYIVRGHIDGDAILTMLGVAE